MLLNKLKQFHQQTMERYRDEENMEPWKKAVMEIHEKATFLFYYDATLEQNSRTATLRNPGNPRERGTPRRKCTSLLYRGRQTCGKWYDIK